MHSHLNVKYAIEIYGLPNQRSSFICAINTGDEFIRQTSLIRTQISLGVKFPFVFTKTFNVCCL